MSLPEQAVTTQELTVVVVKSLLPVVNGQVVVPLVIEQVWAHVMHLHYLSQRQEVRLCRVHQLLVVTVPVELLQPSGSRLMTSPVRVVAAVRLMLPQLGQKMNHAIRSSPMW